MVFNRLLQIQVQTQLTDIAVECYDITHEPTFSITVNEKEQEIVTRKPNEFEDRTCCAECVQFSTLTQELSIEFVIRRLCAGKGKRIGHRGYDTRLFDYIRFSGKFTDYVLPDVSAFYVLGNVK